MSVCIILPGGTSNGYRRVKDVDGKTRGAHVLAWEAAHGRPVPAGMVIDHTCHNIDLGCAGGSGCVHRACVNPDHLEAVTRKENVLRSTKSLAGQNARKTHCPKGHELTEDNTYLWSQSGGRTARACKTCHRARAASRRADARAAKAAA